MSAYSSQVGGSHYKKLVLQPLLLSYLIAKGDSCFTKFLKYSSRTKNPDDLQKARHMCDLAKSLIRDPLSCREEPFNLMAIEAFAAQFETDDGTHKLKLAIEAFFTGKYGEAKRLLKAMEDDLCEAPCQ